MFPIGTYILRAANYTTVETAVEGRWLQGNGVAVSRTTYAELFAYFNALTPALPFGSGDGSTTFNLPDCRGRMLVAEGEHADVDAMGDSDGLAIGIRKPKHHHLSQYGDNSAGGTIPIMGAFDNDGVISYTFPTSPATSNADKANHPEDAPAYLVAGSYFIKFTA